MKVDYFGAVLMTDKMELGQNGRILLAYEDFGFIEEDLSVVEYLVN